VRTEEQDRLRLVERIARGSTTPELRALCRAALEAHDGVRRNEPPIVWAETKARLVEAALAFGRAEEEARDG
jgi:hypothetical protein